MNSKQSNPTGSTNRIGFFDAAILVASDMKRILWLSAKRLLSNVVWLAVGTAVAVLTLLVAHRSAWALGLVVFVVFLVAVGKLSESKRLSESSDEVSNP